MDAKMREFVKAVREWFNSYIPGDEHGRVVTAIEALLAEPEAQAPAPPALPSWSELAKRNRNQICVEFSSTGTHVAVKFHAVEYAGIYWNEDEAKRVAIAALEADGR